MKWMGEGKENGLTLMTRIAICKKVGLKNVVLMFTFIRRMIKEMFDCVIVNCTNYYV